MKRENQRKREKERQKKKANKKMNMTNRQTEKNIKYKINQKTSDFRKRNTVAKKNIYLHQTKTKRLWWLKDMLTNKIIYICSATLLNITIIIIVLIAFIT